MRQHRNNLFNRQLLDKRIKSTTRFFLPKPVKYAFALVLLFEPFIT